MYYSKLTVVALLLAGSLRLCGQEMPQTPPRFSANSGDISLTTTSTGVFPDKTISVRMNEEKYQKFKRMRNAGIGLTAGGVALLTTGIILIRNVDERDYDDYGYHEFSDAEQVVGGMVCIITGVASLGGGITLGAIGTAKMKKYGNAVSLRTTSSGLGLVYRF